MDNIRRFLEERKAAWLKGKIKGNESEEELAKLHQEADEKFSRPIWILDAAKRVGQLTMASHPSKFSHPGAKTSSTIANAQAACDGYLRSGNVSYELDVFGNAAALDVYKFLLLTMNNGLSVLDNLGQDTEAAKTLLDIPAAHYTVLRDAFLSIKQPDTQPKTDHLVKQVYFPVEDGYHLLSILTPSGLMTQVKHRIDSKRFSEEAKAARESRKKHEWHDHGFEDLLNLTVTAYGGTKPQNISVLNNQNAGRAYLLPCVPPVVQKRQVRVPNTNFFTNTLNPRRFKDAFWLFDLFVRKDLNNMAVRQGIRDCLEYIIDLVLAQVFAVREQGGVGWSEREHYQRLPIEQRIWLDDQYVERRTSEDEWLDPVCEDFGRWILNCYERLFEFGLGDDELREVKKLVKEAVSADKEFFK